MEIFEHDFNIGDNERKPSDDFNKLIQKLTENNSVLVGALQQLTSEEREHFDMIVLNPVDLSWGAFNAVDSENEVKVIDLINDFNSTEDKNEQKKIAKEIVGILEK